MNYVGSSFATLSSNVQWTEIDTGSPVDATDTVVDGNSKTGVSYTADTCNVDAKGKAKNGVECDSAMPSR